MSIPRRPGPSSDRGVVASAAVVGLVAALATGCGSSKVPIDSPELVRAEATACAALVGALPDTLAGELRRSVDPDDALGAAWGDPAYVLTCGVDRPESYTEDASCNEVRGVGWFVSQEQMADPRVDATAYALTHTPYVELVIPARYRTDGVDRALATLAPRIKQHLTPGTPCI